MRGKKYYALVIGLILVGIGTFVFYRQQQEARILAFEGYEISLIEEEVEALFNADKTDIERDVPEEKWPELETTFLGLMDQDFSGRNERKVQAMHADFLVAYDMYKVERDVDALFEDGRVVKESVTLDAVDTVKLAVENFGEKPVYYERNIERVDEAREQVETIERARTFLADLYDEEGRLMEFVTREDEEEALEWIRQVKNPSVREKLRADAERLNTALTAAEEASALEEQRLLEEQAALEEEQRLLEEEAVSGLEEEAVTDPVDPWTPPANDGGSTWQPSPPPANNPNPPVPAPTPPPAPAPNPEPVPVDPDPEPEPEPEPIEPPDPVDENTEE